MRIELRSPDPNSCMIATTPQSICYYIKDFQLCYLTTVGLHMLSIVTDTARTCVLHSGVAARVFIL
jgi:hypothetical protein